MLNAEFKKETFKNSVKENVKMLYRKNLEDASQQEIYQAVCYAVKDVIIDNWLKTQKAVTRVIYPGLPEHPGHEIMKKQARGFGAMLSIQLESKEFALAILEKVRMIRFAESLGGVETLVTYPTTQTHADVPKEIRERNGITESTLRFSVGIENIEDLIGELEKVFAEIEEEKNDGKKS